MNSQLRVQKFTIILAKQRSERTRIEYKRVKPQISILTHSSSQQQPVSKTNTVRKIVVAAHANNTLIISYYSCDTIRFNSPPNFFKMKNSLTHTHAQKKNQKKKNHTRAQNKTCFILFRIS